MALEDKTTEIDDTEYKFTEGLMLQDEGNILILTATDPSDDTETQYRLRYTRVKGATTEEILRQALQSDGIRLNTGKEVIVEDPILQTYDLYEFDDVEQFN